MDAATPPCSLARPDLGRVVHVHQGRGARARPGDADRGADRARGADARARRAGAGRRPATLAELRRFALPLVVVGLVNTAAPFWLLSWGETRIDSGLAAIIQAAVPIFMAVFAFGFFRDQRVTGLRLAGLAGRLRRRRAARRRAAERADPRRARRRRDGDLLRRRRPARGRHLREASPTVVALGTCTVAALVALGRGSRRRPATVPGWKPIASVVVLGVFGTAAAYLLFFAIVGGAGAARAGLVTYLVPPIAVAYGAVFLNERIGAAAFAAFVLILGGVALAARARRPATVEA